MVFRCLGESDQKAENNEKRNGVRIARERKGNIEKQGEKERARKARNARDAGMQKQ